MPKIFSKSKIYSCDKTISWHHKDGRKRLLESKYHQDFFYLAHHFQAQLKPTFCGVASGVIILNALRCRRTFHIDSDVSLKIPESHGGGELAYNYYSQSSFLNEGTDIIKDAKVIEGIHNGEGDEFDPGMNLNQLANKLRLYLLDVTVKPVECEEGAEVKPALHKFRQDLQAYLNDSDTFMIANFYGKVINKQVGGHFSPIAAYHKPSDSCLVMDVAGHKQPWFWVGLEDLYYAMAVKDGDNTRGYLLVSDKL